MRRSTESVDAPRRQGARLRRTAKYGARSATQQERMQRRSNAAVFMKWATKMAFVLKEYQKNALASLEAYLEAARVDGPAAPFAAVRGPGVGPAYKFVEGL